MMRETEEVLRASEQFYAAANQVVRGDAEDMLALWSRSAQATYLDPGGHTQQAWEALRAYWERAAELNQQPRDTVTARAEVLAAHTGGDLGYVVTLEHLELRHAGDAPRRMVARATNVYQREDGVWKLLHRHAEPPRP